MKPAKINPILKSLLLSLTSAFLLSMPWVFDITYCLFFGFAPLLWMQYKQTKGLLWWALLTFTIWIIATCWWVSIATLLALIMVPLVGLCFTWVPFALYVKLSKNASESVKWILFVTIWLCFEALYMYNDISFPWLTLGNALNANVAQWYCYTGVFGGSLNILIANILVFKSIAYLYKAKQERRKILIDKYLIMFLLVVFIPTFISLMLKATYEEKSNPVQVTIIEPNFNAYTEKFTIPTSIQVDTMLALASNAPKNTQFFIAPETAIENIWINDINSNQSIDTLRGFIKKYYPDATFVIGASTYYKLSPQEHKADVSHYPRRHRNGRYFYARNTALWIDSTKKVEQYHKAKLVCGVELLPYPAVFGFINQFTSVNLGGMSGNCMPSIKREAFKGVGTAICYEAIYGEFFTEYVKAGAKFMFIISNDGWWGDTNGHKHLLKYSTHRAIETRRSIARSANTGISAIINQKGEVIDSLGWGRREIINATINANEYVTFYVKNGDYIIRIAFYVLLLTLGYMVAIKYYRKNNSINGKK